MLAVAAYRGGPPPAPAPCLWWQRFQARRPQTGGRLDADDIGQPGFGDAIAEVGAGAVSRIRQDDVGADPARQGGTKLVKCNLRLGLEDDIVGHTGLSTPVWIVSPLMRQVQPIRDRQVDMIVCHRQADRGLAVVLFAKLPAVLPRNGNRRLALFGHAGVIDDQGPDRAVPLDDGRDMSTHCCQHRCSGPQSISISSILYDCRSLLLRGGVSVFLSVPRSHP